MLLQLSNFPSYTPLCPAPHPTCITLPSPQFMSMGCTYKFFGVSISYTILNLHMSILYMPIMLLIPCTFPPIPPVSLPTENPPYDVHFSDSVPLSWSLDYSAANCLQLAIYCSQNHWFHPPLNLTCYWFLLLYFSFQILYAYIWLVLVVCLIFVFIAFLSFIFLGSFVDSCEFVVIFLFIFLIYFFLDKSL